MFNRFFFRLPLNKNELSFRMKPSEMRNLQSNPKGQNVKEKINLLFKFLKSRQKINRTCQNQ